MCFQILEMMVEYGSVDLVVLLIFKFNFLGLAVDVVDELDSEKCLGQKLRNYDYVVFHLKKFCKLLKK